jgi:hypothetical protein
MISQKAASLFHVIPEGGNPALTAMKRDAED